MQYIFGDAYPLSYAPSLAAAGALRRRVASRDGGGAWRPGHLQDFVVWKAGEPAENIAEFQRSAEALRAGMQARGRTYGASVGLKATRQALLDTLEKNECVRLSCHGRGDSHDLRFDLLVAADGFLPPASSTVLADELGTRFLVGWQELAALATAPPLVFSAACASGLAASVRGGERIGLERSMLRAGTVTYTAPQWPVPVAVIQPLVNRVILAYFDTPEQTLAETVFRVTNEAIREGVTLRVARSLAVHGDWL